MTKTLNASLEANFKELKEQFFTVSNLLNHKDGVQVPDKDYTDLDNLADALYTMLRYIFDHTDIATLPVVEKPFETVDLGLPSGRKWATWNIGATTPEEVGFLLSFDQSNAVSLPDGFKVPTSDDFQELCDNCDWEWTTENGVKGCRFKSRQVGNGNSVFFPCSGYGYSTSWYLRGSHGFYWASSLHSASLGRLLYFYSGGVDPQSVNHRFFGFAVRPVQ